MSVIFAGTNSRGVVADHADLDLPDAGTAGSPSGGWALCFIANFGTPQNHREHPLMLGAWPDPFLEFRIYGSAEGNANLMAVDLYYGGDDHTIFFPNDVRDGTLHRFRLEMSAAGVLQCWEDGAAGDNTNLSADYGAITITAPLLFGTEDQTTNAPSHVTAPQICELMFIPRPLTANERTQFDTGSDGNHADWPGKNTVARWHYKLLDNTSPCPNSGSGSAGGMTLTSVTSFGSHPISYGSAPVDDSISESLSLTEAFSESGTYDNSISESLSLTDSFVEEGSYTDGITETLGLTDSVLGVSELLGSITETLSLTDELASETQYDWEDQVLSFADSWSEEVVEPDEGVYNDSILETLSLSDSWLNEAQMADSIVETIGLFSAIDPLEAGSGRGSGRALLLFHAIIGR